jgi:Ras family protein T1
MNNDTIRVVVCGDEGVGKSSLITSLVKDVFVPNIQATLPPITIPSEYSTSPDIPYTTVLVDASSLIQDRQQLQKEIRRATVIWLVYSDHYTC